MTDKIVVITPPVASTAEDEDLVALTEFIHKSTLPGEPYGYGLGGPFGYGIEFENDTFEMHPFWWGDCTCGVPEDANGFSMGGHQPTCRYEMPNFRHKTSGIEVRWYKWIGRSMEWKGQPSPERWRAIFAECVASVSLGERRA